MIRVAIIAAALTHGISALDAETITCSLWQGITTCSSPSGYVSHETQWQGITTGQDNQGRPLDAKRMAGAGDHHSLAARTLTA